MDFERLNVTLQNLPCLHRVEVKESGFKFVADGHTQVHSTPRILQWRGFIGGGSRNFVRGSSQKVWEKAGQSPASGLGTKSQKLKRNVNYCTIFNVFL